MCEYGLEVEEVYYYKPLDSYLVKFKIGSFMPYEFVLINKMPTLEYAKEKLYNEYALAFKGKGFHLEITDEFFDSASQSFIISYNVENNACYTSMYKVANLDDMKRMIISNIDTIMNNKGELFKAHHIYYKEMNSLHNTLEKIY